MAKASEKTSLLTVRGEGGRDCEKRARPVRDLHPNGTVDGHRWPPGNHRALR